MRESRKKVESSPMITILNVITVLVLLAAILSPSVICSMRRLEIRNRQRA